MKIASLRLSCAGFRLPGIAVTLVGMAVLATAAMAQQPGPPTAEGPMAHRHFPPPKNLKVLPKNLTGDQVVDIMRHWAGDLGQKCSTCHAEYPDHRKNERGEPMLDFPSDAKPQKHMARIMYKMMQVDKNNYVQKVADLDTDTSKPMAAPLTCGTCHRGHLDPEAYVPPKREERRPEGAPPSRRN